MNSFVKADRNGNEQSEVQKGKASRRGLLLGGAGLGLAGIGAIVGVPEYQKRRAESERQKARQEFIVRADDVTSAIIHQIDDPALSVEGGAASYDYDPDVGLLVFHSADRDYDLNGSASVSVFYEVMNAEDSLRDPNVNTLIATVLPLQPTRLEVYKDSPFGGTVEYIAMNGDGEVFYNHAFGDDDFENPYDDLPAVNIESIEPTLNEALRIVSEEGGMFY